MTLSEGLDFPCHKTIDSHAFLDISNVLYSSSHVRRPNGYANGDMCVRCKRRGAVQGIPLAHTCALRALAGAVHLQPRYPVDANRCRGVTGAIPERFEERGGIHCNTASKGVRRTDDIHPNIRGLVAVTMCESSPTLNVRKPHWWPTVPIRLRSKQAENSKSHQLYLAW